MDPKNKRKSKARASPLRTNSKRGSVQGLVTSKQAVMSSQASVYTHRTNRTQASDMHSEQDMLFDEGNNEDLKQIFITEEEQKVIQKILEIARKGKINQKNAFDIPLKVALQQQTDTVHNRFWKFASELLSASINIYDKRIQNTWLTTNKVHSKLMRINFDQKTKDDDEREEANQFRKNRQLVLLPIEEFRDSSILENLRFGQSTLQDIKKITVINIHKHFISDPLYHQKLRAFDNSSIRALLLNVFDIREDLQISLFNEGQNFFEKKDSIKQLKSEECNHNFFIEPAPTEMFGFLTDWKRKNFPEMMKKTDEVIRQSKQKAFQQDFFQKIQENLLFQNPVQLSQFHHEDPPQFDHQFPENNNQINYEKDSIKALSQVNPFQHQEVSQTGYSQTNFSEGLYTFNVFEDQDNTHTTVIPYEIEFRGNKLSKKKLVTSSSRLQRTKRTKKRKNQESQLIEFDPLIVEKVSRVLKMDKKKKKVLNSRKKKQKNLLPPSMSIYDKFHRRKVRVPSSKYDKQKPSQQFDSQVSFLDQPLAELKEEQTKMKKQINQQNKAQLVTIQETFEHNFPTESYQSSQPKGGYIQKNMRQVKKIVYERICDEREVRLSQMGKEISPQGMLIAFLHIANEKNLVVRHNEEASNIMLSWE